MADIQGRMTDTLAEIRFEGGDHDDSLKVPVMAPVLDELYIEVQSRI